MKSTSHKLILLALISFLLCFSETNAFSQSDLKVREFYLSGVGLMNPQFGMQYKSSSNGKIFFRYSFIQAETRYHVTQPVTSTAYRTSEFYTNLAFEAGIEYRKMINERLSLYTGLNIIAGGAFGRTNHDNPLLPIAMRKVDNYTFSPGLGLNSGILLNLKGGFMLGAEIAPSLNVSYRMHEVQVDVDASDFETRTNANLKLDTQSIRISLIYQWNKEG